MKKITRRNFIGGISAISAPMILGSKIIRAHSNEENKICSGFAKWTEDGEFKQVRDSKCMTESEYQAYLNAPDYLCKYYVKSIWKESERAYGKKQYKYTDKKLLKIKRIQALNSQLKPQVLLKKSTVVKNVSCNLLSFQ